jgi:hypothetical protein
MSFLLTRIENLLSFIIYMSWYLLFYVVVSIKERNLGKYFSTSQSVFSLFVILHIFCRIDIHFLIKLSIFLMSLHMLLIQIKEKASQCVSDVESIVISSIKIYLVSSLKGLPPAPISLYLFFLLNKRRSSCFSYLFVISLL